MKTSEKFDEIIAALTKAQGAIGVASKNSTNPHFKSKYADLESINATIMDPLLANGIFLAQDATNVVDNSLVVIGVSITTRVSKNEQWLEVGPLVVPLDANNRNQAQAMGSAATYGRRYALSALFNISTADDDANSVVKHEHKIEKVVSKPKLAQIKSALAEVDGDVAKFCECLNVSSLEEIKSSDFDAAMERIGAKRRRLASDQQRIGGENNGRA
jgi:hypothetical protein